jgi:hypothetical protein
LILWENINDNRATHIFLANKNTHDDDLNAIEAFILSPISDKRAILHGGYANTIEIRKRTKYLTSILHDTLSDYQSRFLNLIYNY